MEPRKEQVKKMTQALKKRLFLTFGQARKKAKETHRANLTHIGRFAEQNTRAMAFLKRFWEQCKLYFSNTYARLVTQGKYTRRDFTILFVLALLLGGVIKMVALHTITIGFEDYTLAPKETLYDMNLVQQKVIDSGDALSKSSTPTGKVCSELDN